MVGDCGVVLGARLGGAAGMCCSSSSAYPSVLGQCWCSCSRSDAAHRCPRSCYWQRGCASVALVVPLLLLCPEAAKNVPVVVCCRWKRDGSGNKIAHLVQSMVLVHRIY